ncbi:hypothetical protein Tco_0445280, partial [Tanacetum coccineum]
ETGGFKSKVLFIQTSRAEQGRRNQGLVSVDSMVNWSDHEGEDVEIGAAQVYGMLRLKIS